MGCDIHSTAEKKVSGQWQVIPDLHPFDWRSYAMFGFLANVRNYSAVTPISDPRGLPPDAALGDEYAYGDHSLSWLSVQELLDFDYDRMTEDRRYMGPDPRDGFMNGALTAEPGDGKAMTYREFLGDAFFEDLQKLKDAGAERIVFGFDS